MNALEFSKLAKPQARLPSGRITPPRRALEAAELAVGVGLRPQLGQHEALEAVEWAVAKGPRPLSERHRVSGAVGLAEATAHHPRHGYFPIRLFPRADG